MAQGHTDPFTGEGHSNWVRIRTLVILRWFAVAGQAGAVLVAHYVFHLNLEIGLIAMTIGVSILANIVSTFIYPENRRLTENEAFFMIGFDLGQLGVLLYLTGGLNNPFALLILAPVTIAATVLPARGIIVIGLSAIAIVGGLAMQSLPLMTDSGFPLLLPRLFVFGFWSALMVGVVFIGIYARQVTQEIISMGDALTATQMALAREQKLTDLGGVVAAAAHELGTPLATIKLVSSELLDELDESSDLHEDARLIRDQADRCRDILRSMGRAGKDDKHLRSTPLETLVQEAAEPHMNRGKSVLIELLSDADPADQPIVLRRPEVIHGLRNLVQNAVDFAESTVLVSLSWTDASITVRISDDGQGFPASVIGRIGDPFVRRRRWSLQEDQRPGYEGMGLGLFIAKTLLERSGADLDFANGGARALADRPGGAIVTVTWARDDLDAKRNQASPSLGENERIS